MPYEIKIKDQETGKEIRQEIETLKQMKWILLQYKNRTIELEVRKIKERSR